MARPISNKILIALFLCTNTALAQEATYKCEEVEVTSLTVKEKEKPTYCFMKKSDDYFLSNNCLTLKCEFLSKMKDLKFESSENERPGRSMCKTMGGAVERIEIKGRGEHLRCVSRKEHSSISLNLLESWNGKIFTGPGKIDYSISL